MMNTETALKEAGRKARRNLPKPCKDERLKRCYEIVERAANNDCACPTNAQLADMLGYAGIGHPSGLLSLLETMGFAAPSFRLRVRHTSPPFLAASSVKGNRMSEGNVAAEQLRLFVERIERLEDEKKGLQDDIKDVYLELKANGYDVKTVRSIVRLRRMERNARMEAEALLETYKNALGIE